MTALRSDRTTPVRPLDAADPVAAFGALGADDLIALGTSGTSGTTRSVLRTVRSWTDSFPAVTALTGLTDESRLWLPGPLTATMNLFAAVHAASVGAVRVRDLARATHVHLTPTGLRRVLDDGTGSSSLAGRTLVVAGDALPTGLRAHAEAVGATVHHYYGAAELSFVAWGADRDDLTPFPGVEVDVRDGEIWVRTPYAALGYGAGVIGPLRRDAEGWATVGDRGHLGPGGVVVVDGRPGTVLTGGATVPVADVEAVLRPVVRGEVVVLGLPHPRFGEVVVAVLTDVQDLAPARAAAAGLGAARPRRWLHRDVLPVTAAGKLDRVALADLVRQDLP